MPSGRVLKHWAHVYLSHDKTKAGAERWTRRGSNGAVHWKEHSPASYTYYLLADGARHQEL